MTDEITSVQRIAVIGGGLMGSGIVQVVARAGFDVTLVELDDEGLTRGLRRVRRGYERLAAKRAELKQELDEAFARISGTTDLEASATADHVIETVVEDLQIKTAVLGQLDHLCRDEVVFASNTSQYAITRLAAATKRPDRVIGSHWFNPPPVMNLIEIVRGVETSDQTLELAMALAGRYGKEVITCNKDTQGFITSRLIVMLMVEAARIVDEGVASIEDVNKACRLAFNHAQGPLDTADLSGLDTVDRVASTLVAHYGERFLPPQNLRRLVDAGHFGRKTGRGFSDYGEAR